MTTPIPSPQSTTGKTFLAAVDRVLYPITVGYTVVVLGFQVYEFYQGGLYHPRYPIAEVYLTLLTAYAAQREGVKWLGAEEAVMRIRRGELFVGLWFAVYLLMWAMANLSTRWVLPAELQMITLGVLGIFVLTGVSSGIRSRSGRVGAADKAVQEASKQEQILQLLGQKESVSAEEAGQTLGFSKPTAWRILEALEKDKRVIQDASTNSRERRYRLPR